MSSSPVCSSPSFASTSELSDSGRFCPPRRPRRRRLRFGRSSVSPFDSDESDSSASTVVWSTSSVSSACTSESGRRLRVRFLPPRLLRWRLAFSLGSELSSWPLSSVSVSVSTSTSSLGAGANSAPHILVRIPVFWGDSVLGCCFISRVSAIGAGASGSAATGAGS